MRIGLDDETVTGMVVWGSERAGWCEISGVSGGGRMSENSAARLVRGVCFGESAMRRLVFSERRPTSDWGVMSFAYAVIGLRSAGLYFILCTHILCLVRKE